MKRNFKKIFATILFLVMVVTIAPPMSANASGNSIVYVSLGDSLTDYATYSGKSWTNYPKYVSEKISHEKGINIIVKNDAVSGFLADSVNRQLANDANVIADVMEADVVTLMIGGNDVIVSLGAALYEKGYNVYELIGGTKLSASSVQYKTIYDTLSNKNNIYHKQYISGIDAKIRQSVETIRKYNPDCEIAIATLYYNDRTGVGYLQKLLGLSAWDAYIMSVAYKSAITEMRNYFKELAKEDAHITYVDVDSLANAKYLQLDSKGSLLDFHPNEAGQKEFANCFYNDFWTKIDLDSIAKKNVSGYEFYAINNSEFSAKNAVIGDKTSISIDADGVGCKLNCIRTTSAKSISFTEKPAKAAGVISGISFWDDSNASEILLRFEGTNTNNLAVCVGGNGKYVAKYIDLGFDASLVEHEYCVDFATESVIVYVDGKRLGTVDTTNVDSPRAEVSPVIFIQRADWIGQFAGKKCTTIFSNIN